MVGERGFDRSHEVREDRALLQAADFRRRPHALEEAAARGALRPERELPINHRRARSAVLWVGSIPGTSTNVHSQSRCRYNASHIPIKRGKPPVTSRPVLNSPPFRRVNGYLPYSAKALEPLKKMSHLRQLMLCSDGLLDDGLAEVKAAPHLLSLGLKGHFTNEGLKHLSELPAIRRLSLSGRFDDEGLVHR